MEICPAFTVSNPGLLGQGQSSVSVLQPRGGLVKFGLRWFFITFALLLVKLFKDVTLSEFKVRVTEYP